MEWIVLLAFAVGAGAYILFGRATADVAADTAEALRAERAGLLALLRELDEDARVGRISAADRQEGRHALGPRLRQVTEALDALGEPRDAPAPRAATHNELAEPGDDGATAPEAALPEPASREGRA